MRKTGSVFETARRLCVIVVEDAVLHPRFAELVYLVAACARGYRAGLRDVEVVAGIAFEAAGVRGRDELEGEEGGDGGVGGWAGGLVECLRVRMCYGGMGGDVEMFRRGAGVWEGRFGRDEGGWGILLRGFYEGERMVVGEGVVERLLEREDVVLRTGDVPLAAFDFHCCAVGSEVARAICAGKGGGAVRERFFGGFDDVRQGVERMIWRFWSGVSFKVGWSGIEGAKSVCRGDGRRMVKECRDGDEVLWIDQVEGLVVEWCRQYRKRFGL